MDYYLVFKRNAYLICLMDLKLIMSNEKVDKIKLNTCKLH